VRGGRERVRGEVVMRVSILGELLRCLEIGPQSSRGGRGKMP